MAKRPFIDIPAIVADSVLSEEKTWPVFGGGMLDRNSVLTSSESSTCLRSLFLKKRAPSHLKVQQQSSWGFAQRGHALEAWIVDKLRGFFTPEELRFAGDDQVSFISADGRLSGTPDGVLMIDEGGSTTPILLEIKSIDPRAKLNGQPKPAHFVQVQQNMGILRDNGSTVMDAIIVYVDANNYENMTVFEVAFDTRVYDACKQRGGELARLLADFDAATDGMPDDAAYAALLDMAKGVAADGLTNGGNDCAYCPFTEECSQMQVAKRVKQDKIVPMKMPEFAPRGLAVLIDRFAALKVEQKEVGELLDDVSNKIKASLDESGAASAASAKNIVTITQVAGRKTLDAAAYIAHTGVPADDFYKVGKPSIRLDVKKIDEAK